MTRKVTPPRQTTRTDARAPRGYSLTEILVALAILSILVALLLGSMATIRKRANQAAASVNLRSLAASSIAYAADHNGNIPPYRSDEYTGDMRYWLAWLPAFYGADAAKTMKTPGDDLKQANNPDKLRGPEQNVATGAKDIYYSYARNLELPKPKGGTFNGGTVKVIQLPEPSRTMLFIETRQNAAMYSSYAESYFNFDDGRTAVVFLDGHAERVAREAILGTPSTPEGREYRQLFWFGHSDATSRRDY